MAAWESAGLQAVGRGEVAACILAGGHRVIMGHAFRKKDIAAS